MLDKCDDYVLECILRYCPSKTLARLSCVSRRFAPLIRRRICEFGLCMQMSPETQHSRTTWCRQYIPYVKVLYCTKISLWRLPIVQSCENLEVLILKRANINVSSIIRLQHLTKLQRLEVHTLTRGIDQDDRLYISLLPKSCTHVRLVVDDMWHAVVVNRCNNIRNLEITCLETKYARLSQPLVIIHDIKGLQRLSVTCHNRISISNSMPQSEIKTLVIRCDALRMCRALYKLIGPQTRHIELLLPKVNVLVWDIGYKCIRYLKLMASEVMIETIAPCLRQLHVYGKYVSTKKSIPNHVQCSITGIRCRYPVSYHDL
jgi:hypothetical protein